MGTPFQGTMDGTDGKTPAKVRIRLDADTADLLVGGGGRGGDIKLRDDKDVVKIHFEAGGAEKVPFGAPAVESITETIVLSGGTGTISAGVHGQAGSLVLKDNLNKKRVMLSGTADISVGDTSVSDFIWLTSKDGKPRIHLDGGAGDIWLGGYEVNGDLSLLPKDVEGPHDQAKASIRLDGGESSIRLRGPKVDKEGFPKERIHLDAGTGDIWLGGNDVSGDLLLMPGTVEGKDVNDKDKATIRLDAQESSIRLRGPVEGTKGYLKERIHLDAGNGNIWLGGNHVNGDLMLLQADVEGDLNDASKATIRLNAETGEIQLKSKNQDENGNDKLVNRIQLKPERGKILLGGNGAGGDLLLFSSDKGDNEATALATIWMQGETGDIILQNGDCAEDFDVSESEEIDPGTVMVLDPEGRLQQSREVYDKRVAGVISGAGNYRPGIILDKKSSPRKRMPLALVGKVYCKVDAQYSPIEVGDLLTTSATSGHAMKATDPFKAFGAVIGKALRPLQTGQGLIPILIALQ